MRLSEAVDFYILHAISGRALSPKSQAAYTQDVDDIEEFMTSIGVKDVSEIGERHLDAYRDRFAGNSVHTAMRRFRILKRMFDFLSEHEQIPPNHVVGNYAAPQRKVNTPRQAGAVASRELADSIRGRDAASLRDRAFVEVMLATGLNAKAAVELQAKNIDLDRGNVVVGSEEWGLSRQAIAVLRSYLKARNRRLARGRSERAPDVTQEFADEIVQTPALWVSLSQGSFGRAMRGRSIYDILAAREREREGATAI